LQCGCDSPVLHETGRPMRQPPPYFEKSIEWKKR
jgi:hypothetical protein